jgi:acyl-CoA thioesterase
MVDQSQTWEADDSWVSIAGGLHGGLVAGRLLDAAAAGEVRTAAAGLRAATVHLLQRIEAGIPAQVRVQVDRGGSTRSMRVEMHQRQRLVAVAQVLAVPTATGVPPLHGTATTEAVGVPADGVPFDALAAFVPFARHLEIRALGEDLPLAGGPDPRLQGWVRLRAASLPPLVQLAVLADALPPASFAVLDAPVPLPTVELTLHLAGPLPPPRAWVRICQRTAWATAGAVVDDAVLHDEEGRLVARVRQTRRAPAR